MVPSWMTFALCLVKAELQASRGFGWSGWSLGRSCPIPLLPSVTPGNTGTHGEPQL